MKIVLCSASRKEIFKIIKHFNASLLTSSNNKSNVYHYSNQQAEIYFIIAGMGNKNLRKNLDYFIEKYQPDKSFLWILTGYAGAVSEDLKTGDMVVPDVVRADGCIYRLQPNRYIKSERSRVLFEVNSIYGETEKRDLKTKYPDIDVIDMESAAFCEIMTLNNFTDCFIFKSITDNLTFKFPDTNMIRDSVSKFRLKPILSLILNDRRQLKSLIMLSINVRKASKKIYQFFIRFYKKHED